MSNRDSSPSANKVFEIFEQGKMFTKELLQENERLRLVIGSLRAEMRDMEKQYVKVEVPRLQQKVLVLEEEVKALRNENHELRQQFTSVEEENREFADRYVTIEKQNSDLINLYVASYRLHSTLAYEEVVGIIKEVVINMIGSEEFGIYLCDEENQMLTLIGHEGEVSESFRTIPMGEGRAGEVAQTGEVYTMEATEAKRSAVDEPIACIPLCVGETVLGVIVIFQLLVQKDGFTAVDFELFELLGGHAATAIYASTLYTRSERKRSTLEGFVDLLKQG